ncbi:MAG: AraC family ligand binding domain-containing protein [Bacteroidota bacterium]
MRSIETAGEFYSRFTSNTASDPGKFNIFLIEEFEKTTPLPHYRRDFYKISLLTKGSGILAYADQAYMVSKPILTFSNPMIPYSWEPEAKNEEGFFCLFTEAFLNNDLKTGGLTQSPLFSVGGRHVLFPEKASLNLLKYI